MKFINLKMPKLQWFIIIPIFIGIFFAVLNLSEWYKIGIMKEFADYPFGGEGPVPYYYKTPELYSLVNATFGFIFLILSLLCTWAFIRDKRKTGLVASALIFIGILLLILNSKVGL